MWVKPNNMIIMEKHLHIPSVTIKKRNDELVMDKHLHIPRVTRKEQGNYRCITRNDYGHDEKSYELEIISKLLLNEEN